MEVSLTRPEQVQGTEPFNSSNRLLARRIDHRPFRPQRHHSNRCIPMFDWGCTPGNRTEPRHDSGGSHTRWLGHRPDVHVCTCIPGRVCTSTVPRHDCGDCTANDRRGVHSEHVWTAPSLNLYKDEADVDLRWVGYGSLHAPATSQFQWRFPLALQVVPALVLAMGMFFLPESPRFLIEKGRYSEARNILHRLHFDGTNADWVEVEYTGIRTAIEAEKSTAATGWMAMFTVPQWRTRLLFVHIQTFSQAESTLTSFVVTVLPYKCLRR